MSVKQVSLPFISPAKGYFAQYQSYRLGLQSDLSHKKQKLKHFVLTKNINIIKKNTHHSTGSQTKFLIFVDLKRTDHHLSLAY